MPVNFIRDEVKKELTRWELIKHCSDGQDAIKTAGSGGDRYLPRPNADDTSEQNRARFRHYVDRAVFYNVTRRTLDGLIGQVFLRDPLVEIPPVMDLLKEDVDGAGVGLDQQAKKALRNVLAYGRAGLLSDYPPIDAVATKADLENGFVRPTITLYDPWTIINWRTITVGARKLLSLVVLLEKYIVDDDGFECKKADQYRVLSLTNGSYKVEVYQSSNGLLVKTQEYEPKDGTGATLREIPFKFIGAANNDEELDGAPIYDLAVLNIAHYRNSADYEESCYMVGQPTPVFSGLTQSWVKEVLENKFQLGSRGGIPLPAGGTAVLLQALPNTIVYEAMEAKERQMVALGAKLVETTNVQRTFGEAQLEEASETSILSTAAKNVSVAYRDILKWSASFMNAPIPEVSDDKDGTGLKYELNTDFPAARMSPQERAQLILEWQGGAISFSEMRSQLRKVGVASLDDEAVKEEIDSMPIGTRSLADETDDLEKAKADEK